MRLLVLLPTQYLLLIITKRDFSSAWYILIYYDFLDIHLAILNYVLS